MWELNGRHVLVLFRLLDDTDINMLLVVIVKGFGDQGEGSTLASEVPFVHATWPCLQHQSYDDCIV